MTEFFLKKKFNYFIISLIAGISDLSGFISTHSKYTKEEISSYIYPISNDLLTMNILYSYFSKDTDTAIKDYFFIVIISSIAFLIIIIVITSIEIKRSKNQLSSTKSLLFHTLNTQEQERSKISRELHDTLAQDMRYVNLLASKISDTKLKNEIKEKQTECINQIRTLCNNYATPVIMAGDFVSALNTLIFDFNERNKINGKLIILEGVDFTVFDNNELISLYRIVQEALFNILYHAEATEYSVLFRRDKNNNRFLYKLIITDDGKGIEPEILQKLRLGNTFVKKEDGYHFGIKGIKERVDFLGGNFKIDSVLNEGTEIMITIEI